VQGRGAGSLVIARLTPRRRTLVLLLSAIAGLCFLSGCESEGYSEALEYGLRTDPIFNTLPTDESDFPDSPGQLPLLSIDDIDNPYNPLYAKSAVYGKSKYLRDPAQIKPKDADALEKQLVKHFGTPAEPRVKVANTDPKVDKKLQEMVKELQIDPVSLREGSRLYRVHCLHCHGLTGDGRGPTARWVNPHPRDYRRGLFKFQSVDQATKSVTLKPRREDIRRTLKMGIENSSMPSFALLINDEEIDRLISYVIHLSIRGEVEYQVFSKYLTFKKGQYSSEGMETPIPELVPQLTELFVTLWHESQNEEIIPDKRPVYKTEKERAEAAKRGWDIFRGKAAVQGGATCISCHTDYGRQSRWKFDEWGTLVRPTNLTAGYYRGGRRPIDLYYRIHSGINGSGMAHNGANFRQSQEQKDRNEHPIWDLVSFLQVLPYPQMLQAYGIHIGD
jgi:mono/diheme cytochrome c family protein